MHESLIAPVLLIAACGGSPHVNAPSNDGPGRRTTPCPTGAALDTTAIAAWQQGPGEVTATCGELVTGGRSAWVISGWHERASDDGSGLGHWVAVVRPDGQVLSRDGEDDLPPGAIDHSTGEGWTAADLDGDGDDELIHVVGYSHMGYSNTMLLVMRVTGGALVQVGDTLELDSDNTAAIVEDDPEAEAPRTCTGTWSVTSTSSGQRLDIQLTGDPGCPREHHVLAVRDGALVAAR